MSDFVAYLLELMSGWGSVSARHMSVVHACVDRCAQRSARNSSPPADARQESATPGKT
jgi:hypothetical protein